ncbi:MAG: nucleotidyl transferase AbiEii/AbiGii toxin family protein [Lactococcus lactis]|nr:nucleotidyl transferase AbiEii/AbiGii toxin family protein [Atopostipes suicloacalis]MDN6292502.1 nucleotidyl transferase AbiEii/AbiGii toxin family protein [Tetragenococcus halophilus]MDN6386043.1 nucleotidyl transferase AbiEii/AbiGii toxin family protein [Alkalibacterium sp.]MDN6389941.1 nucleotidyl transferase AbiEii/AbiGii toxin family protein [Lactococcus lactis]MDN6731607.1 nucleotidyl transferase AbiEii/AbiGii toxin family protein [Atopostipes suicloacalis]
MTSPSSLLAKLKNESIRREIPNQQMIVLFLQEEFSRRLGKSNYVNQLILKGGFLLFSLGAGDTRATMDSDYLMKNLANKKENVKAVIQEIIAIDNDGDITFEWMDMEIITEQNDYHGFRIKLMGIIGRTRTPIFVDLGVGDIIVPESEFIRLETIIDGFQEPEIRSYSMETIVAEKLDAILYLMEASSRMKDFYDLYYLALSKNFNGAILKEAIYTTFKNRGHLDLIKNIYEINRFKKIENTKNMWNRFVEKEIKVEIEFDQVIDKMIELTLPICEAIENNEEFNQLWSFKKQSYVRAE